VSGSVKPAAWTRRAVSAVCAALAAVALGACASSVSTSQFSGEEHQVAQAIASLQSDVNSQEQQKICANDLASGVVSRLSASPGGCKQAIKEQLGEIDNSEIKVQSVRLSSSAGQPTATAQVSSIYSGKTRSATVELQKQGGKWKISAVR
jgi:hypothetical protein